MKKLRWLVTGCALVLALAWVAAPVPATAEQIRLSDGRYLQGDVEDVREDGFVFRLTDTGGRVFLRWNQVDESLKQRLRNEKGPDEGLELEVTVQGARLELIDGTVHEGRITRTGNTFEVVNRERPRGLRVNADDVLEEGFIEGIEIDATVMMTEREVLVLAEERRAPVESARQYYELARIADRLGLYEEAKDYVGYALNASPDAKLQARLTEYDTNLAEVIRQKEVLTAMAAARQLAKQKKYQRALDVLKEVKDTHKPTDAVLAKWEEVNAEVDFDFTLYVIDEWPKLIRTVITAKVRARDSRAMTVQEAMNWARRELDVEIQQRIATTVMSENAADIKIRFAKRFELEEQGRLKLVTRKASFGEDGFYAIVGGHLPVAGRQPAQGNQPQPGQRQPPQPDDRRRDERRDSRNRSVGPIDLEEIERSIRESEFGDVQFQEAPKLPEGISPDDIRDALRRAIEREQEAGGNQPGNQPGGPARQDISNLKVPAVVPSLTDWWEKAGSTTRARWLAAVYAKMGGTMRVVELSNWDVKYR